jgi:hypothetical protein
VEVNWMKEMSGVNRRRFVALAAGGATAFAA